MGYVLSAAFMSLVLWYLRADARDRRWHSAEVSRKRRR